MIRSLVLGLAAAVGLSACAHGIVDARGAFAADPPNASLAFVSGGVESAVTLELREPVLEGDRLTFRVRVLGGTLPATFDDASLFIDAGGMMQLVAYGSQ